MSALDDINLTEDALYWTVRYTESGAEEGTMSKEDAQHHLSNMREQGHDVYLAERKIPAWEAYILNLEARISAVASQEVRTQVEAAGGSWEEHVVALEERVSSTARRDARAEVAAAILGAGGPRRGRTALRQAVRDAAPSWMTQ